MKYADYTRNTSNPIKRIAHSSRLTEASKMVTLHQNMKILDYGCGDGGFFEELVKYIPAKNLYGYDPYLLNEMTFEGANTFDKTDELISKYSGFFDVIYCMEVCEHLTLERNHEIFSNIRKLAKPDAKIVFGVPLETGMSGFLKNLFRVTQGGTQGATVGRAIKSLLSIPIPRATDTHGWIGSHLGFDAYAFSEIFKYGGYKVSKKTYLPFNLFKNFLNNEVYFICELTDIS